MLSRFPPVGVQTSTLQYVVDAGASGVFFKAGAPVCNINKDAPKIRVGTVTGDQHISSTKCELAK